MPSGKTVKLVVFEALQFAAICAPLFVVMERFAGLMRDLKGGNDRTAYWLVVAVSIAYVTSVTLLVWAPLKYLILRRRRFITKIKQWRPAALAYVILCPLPCFALLIAASKVQVDAGQILDHFTELPVSLMLLCLICVDVVERIRPCSLTGKAGSSPGADFDMRGPVLTHLGQVTTVTGQLPHHQPHPDIPDTISQNGSTALPPTDTTSTTATTTSNIINGTPAAGARRYISQDTRRHSTPVRTYLYAPSPCPAPLRFLWSSDPRSEAFADSFLFWLDTAEMLRVAAEPRVFYSSWAIPVFVLAFLSTLRLAVDPRNPLGTWAGLVLQDFPFLVLRLALLGAVGAYVTPVLYVVKNLLVCLSYVYFTFLTRLLKRRSMF
ncbi:transmembrane protein 236 [Gadus morhua]|uniref:Transmembrane protein 236 n=1 Tax=Gadus morhua TaxID=8049 RepID=A0A8C5B5D5_GADMO|nr:transmembrane protein 236-like [Gadus morhua]